MRLTGPALAGRRGLVRRLLVVPTGLPFLIYTRMAGRISTALLGLRRAKAVDRPEPVR
jgi:hypothetical protein